MCMCMSMFDVSSVPQTEHTRHPAPGPEGGTRAPGHDRTAHNAQRTPHIFLVNVCRTGTIFYHVQTHE